MILSKLYFLEETTKEQIRKEQQRLHSWEISESEYEAKYEALMDNYRLLTNSILNDSTNQKI